MKHITLYTLITLLSCLSYSPILLSEENTKASARLNESIGDLEDITEDLQEKISVEKLENLMDTVSKIATQTRVLSTLYNQAVSLEQANKLVDQGRILSFLQTSINEVNNKFQEALSDMGKKLTQPTAGVYSFGLDFESMIVKDPITGHYITQKEYQKLQQQHLEKIKQQQVSR